MRLCDKKWGNVGPFEIIGTSDPRDNVGLRDAEGEWVISPEQGYMSFSHYDDGLMIAFRPMPDGCGWVLVDCRGNCISERFNFIEPANEGFYIVEKGSRHNIMRRDGTCVLEEWPHKVGKVYGGYFQIGNTIRKTKTTPTKYVSGLAHVSGLIVFPMIFDSIEFGDSTAGGFIRAKKEGKSFFICGGALYDLSEEHYRQTIRVDGKYLEQILNWILPGLQLFYRDTDALIDVNKMYPVGKVLRTGRYTSCSTRLQKPIQKTRFLIAAAHVAHLCPFPDEGKNKLGLSLSPFAEKWGQVVLHKNSWLKVLDVYCVGDITQVFMLQIPESAIEVFGDDVGLKLIESSGFGDMATLVDIARKSLDAKLNQEVHPRSIDRDWCQIMHDPIGYDTQGEPYSIKPNLLFDDDFNENGAFLRVSDEQTLSLTIHRLAEDRDVVQDFWGFSWRGFVGSVCEGCVYAPGANGKPSGCGRLFMESFRKNYTKGECEYRKLRLWDESAFEYKAKRKQEEIDLN